MANEFGKKVWALGDTVILVHWDRREWEALVRRLWRQGVVLRVMGKVLLSFCYVLLFRCFSLRAAMLRSNIRKCWIDAHNLNNAHAPKTC